MMRQIVRSGCVAVVACGLSGCSDTPRSIVTAAPVAGGISSNAKVIEFLKRPAESDPAAVAIIDKALRAHTDGHLENLRKLKAIRFSLSGMMVNAAGARLPSTANGVYVWPDKTRCSIENTGAERVQLTVARDGDELWMQNKSVQNLNAGRDEVPAPLRREAFSDLSAHWFWLLGMMAEPGAIVAKRADLGPGDKPLSAVQIWRDGFPDAILYFDPTTAKLARVIYDSDVTGQRVQKRFDLSEEFASGGIKFPGKLLLSANDRVLGDWQLTSVEFPDSIDPKEFREP